jgi:hypothetical protein
VWRFASSPISDLERLCVRDVLVTDQGTRRFLLDGFMTRWFDAFGAKLRKPTGVALIRQPWSYLRLEAPITSTTPRSRLIPKNGLPGPSR